MKKIQLTILEKLDKSQWNTVKFDVIAEHITEKVQPTPGDSEKYIGLEHLDSGSIHIRRWGTPIRLKGEKLKMQKGDIIFGKRNAYLKRASIAPFDGICSAHAMILRAKPDLIDPLFFPFFLNSACFMNRAIAISVGSLSPTINWKTLAKEEFRLPPMEMQKKLSELLWAVDGNIEAITDAGSKIRVLYRSLIKQFLLDYIVESRLKMQKIRTPLQTTMEERKVPSSWKICTIGEVIREYQNGFAEGERAGSGIPQLRMNNINIDGTLNLNSITTIPRKKGFEKYLLRKNDVLFDNTNSADLVGKSIIWNGEISEMVFSNHFTRLRVKENLMLPKFLHIWLLYHFEIGLFQQRCVRWVGQASLQTRDLLSFQILVPTLSEQKIALEKLQHIEDLILVSQNEIQSGKNLQTTLINSIF